MPAEMTEFEIIRRYFTRPSSDPDVVLGVGDDAAVLKTAGAIAVAVDTLVAGAHFPAQAEPDAIAYRSLAVNLSDLAAMGAAPRWCTLALTLPAAEPEWLELFSSGFFALADRYAVGLVGGDLTRGPLTVSVQLIGTVAAAGALTRGGGHDGDDVYVTGTLGDAAAGLVIFERQTAARSRDFAVAGEAQPGGAHAALVARFLRPTPRVEAGLELAGIASAAIDVSDGLLADLTHVCEASRCGAVIDVERLPLSAELESVFPFDVAKNYALSGGDDYELCFTAAPEHAARVDAAMAASGTPVRRIGRLTAGRDVVCRLDGRPFEPRRRGYTHF